MAFWDASVDNRSDAWETFVVGGARRGGVVEAIGSAPPLLEVAIGLVFIWLVASALSAGIVEVVASALGFRAKHLWRELGKLLEDHGAAARDTAVIEAARLAQTLPPPPPALDAFIRVPGVTADSAKRVRHVDTAVAADALTAVATQSQFASTELGRLTTSLPPSVTGDPVKLRTWLSRWLDGRMDDVSRMYRSNVRWWAAVAALLVVGMAGLDSIGLAQALLDEPLERAVITAEAVRAVEVGDQTAIERCDKDDLRTRVTCLREEATGLGALDLSVWQRPSPRTWGGWGLLVLGFLLSWAAVTAGAPFWFSVLKRLMGVRSLPTKTPE